MVVDLTPPEITTRDVAATIPARTVVRNTGGKVDTDFATAAEGTTRPFREQVAGKIIDAEGDVFAEIGNIFNAALLPTIDQATADRLKRAYRSVVLNRTVYLVEKTYWPEQMRDETNIANSYLQDYKDGLAALRSLVERLRSGDGTGDDGDLDGINTSNVYYNFDDGDECRSPGAGHPGGFFPEEGAAYYDPNTDSWKVRG